MTSIRRVRECGATTYTGTGGPVLRLSSTSDGPVAGYAGLTTCSSVWACVTCSAKIAAQRADDLSTVMRAVLDAGGSASLVTLTIRHHRGHRLGDLWDAVAAGWAAVTSGKRWVAEQDTGGLLGWCKVVEVTHGEHGWHVHVHALMCWDRPVSIEWAEHHGARMWMRWSRAVERRGFQSWADQGGLDVRLATLESDGLADYFTKISREITAGYAKTGGGRTPFTILQEAVEGHAGDIALWHEWETVSRDRRQLTWSRGSRDLRRWAGLGVEESDEEIAERDHGGDDVIALPGETWRSLRGRSLAVDLLDVAESGGMAAVRAWLDRRGLECRTVHGAGSGSLWSHCGRRPPRPQGDSGGLDRPAHSV